MRKLETYCKQFFNDIAYRNKAQLKKSDGAKKVDLLCLEVSLLRFLRDKTRENAFEVFYCYCEIFKPFGYGYDKNCERILFLLNAHEENAGRLSASQRDHYAHSVIVFAMGLSIYQNSEAFRAHIQEFFKKHFNVQGEVKERFLLLWGLTSLFHDIGYPFELAFSQIRQYKEELKFDHEDGLKLPTVTFLDLEKFERIPTKLKDYFAELLNGACSSVKEVFAEYVRRVLGGQREYFLELIGLLPLGDAHVDHAYFSAIILFAETAWQDLSAMQADGYLYALTAIILHNKLSRLLCNDKWFVQNVKQFSCGNNPLAWLLLLTDSLQDYGRSCFGKKIQDKGYASDCLFDFSNGGICVEYQHYRYETVKIPTKKDISYIDLQDVFKFVEITKKEVGQIRKKVTYSDRDFFVQILDTAKGIHEHFCKVHGKQPWDSLALEYKLSNIEVAKLYADTLHSLRYFFTKTPCALREITALSKKEMAGLSEKEHRRWVQEKKDMRWTYDPKAKEKDEKRRTHPDLKLEKIQDKRVRAIKAQKDVEIMQDIFEILMKNGYKVYRLP